MIAIDSGVMSSAVDVSGFEEATAGLRPELLAHCYRLLGSIQEAEDQVQETYLRAWRAFHRFEGRASVRTWMYRIATNTCMNARRDGARRPLPTGLGQPAANPRADLVEDREQRWLEPLPDAVLWTKPPEDPAELAAARQGVQVAWVAAIQHLPPRQRAVLVLRDVLAFSAAETATSLGCSVAAANSALQRARATVGQVSQAVSRAAAGSELSEQDQRTYTEFLAAFDAYDIPALVKLLAEQATWQMPPFTGWYRGPKDIAELITTHCPASSSADLRMLPVVVNGQPGAGMYLRQEEGGYDPFQFLALDISAGRITAVTGWFEAEYFTRAQLPAHLPESALAKS